MLIQENVSPNGVKFLVNNKPLFVGTQESMVELILNRNEWDVNVDPSPVFHEALQPDLLLIHKTDAECRYRFALLDKLGDNDFKFLLCVKQNTFNRGVFKDEL